MPAAEATAVIGKSVQVRGEVKGNEDLLVEGLVEGALTLSDGRLTIGSQARVQANVTARDVIVQGTLLGDIHASGRVELRTGSTVTGDIQAARLSIEENAIFSGKVELNNSASPGGERTAQSASSTPAPAGALSGAK